MKKSASILREKGIVGTPQRLAVWKFVDGNKNHPCVESIYEAVKEQFPTISLATVYTILETFKKAGLLQELYIRRDRSCFDSFTNSHHHLLCRVCDKIYDIDVECEIAKRKGVKGHKVESVHGYFYGVCKRCQGGGDKDD